jgi:lipocalin
LKGEFVKLIFITFLFLPQLFASSSFDIKKFSGLWYEIARIDTSFQKDCVASSVEYILDEKDSYKVFNRCFEKELDSKLIQYEGSAKVLENENNISLKMRYFYFFTSKYEIHYLNNYKTAVIKNDDFSNLWIMSRTPSIDNKELKTIINDLENKMDTSKLVFTKLDPKGRYK